jgi:hypothetical protein
MNTQMTLWQVVDRLPQKLPFSKADIESVLSTALTEYQHPSNDAFHFFKGQSTIAKGVTISNVDLRIKREGVHPGFLALDLQGTCIDIDEVRKYYKELEITQVPRGKSLDETTSHTAKQAWGEISFSFSERKPDCLSSISFAPKKS